MNPLAEESPRDPSNWRSLPLTAQVYVASIIAAGAYLMAAFFPLTFPHPVLFGILLTFSCLMSAWKVSLPLSPTNGSTLSVSYAADLGSLLLLGAPQAMVIAAAGAWTQCTFKIKRPYPLYCTVFSMAGAVITIQATALAYSWLRTSPQPLAFAKLPKTIVGMAATHFNINTNNLEAVIPVASYKEQ